MSYDKTIANMYYFYEFTDEELHCLCRYSNSEMFEYRNIIKLKKQNIDGLFYEISQIHGNWNFKDQVLPGLFDELLEQLTDTINIIGKYEKDDLFDNYLIQAKFYENKLRRFNLLKYLTNLIEQKFIHHGAEHLSDTYTHNWLSKEIRKMDKRINNNVFKEYCEYTSDQCRDYAIEGMKKLIIEKLERETLPLLSTPKGLANMFHYEIGQSKEFYKKIKKCFKPSMGNTEYHLGLIPIWEDIPGRGISAYYFDYNEAKWVLIVERAKAPLLADDGIPYGQTGPTILDLFSQIGKEETFLAWFNSKEVKKKIAGYLLFRIIFRFIKSKKELTKEDFMRSSEYAKEKLKLLEDYYGVTYHLEEVTPLIKEREIKCIHGYNLKDEIKEKQIEIVNQLFPN